MKKLSVVLLLAALTLFAAGLIHLFNLRFQAGDNYPPYSSFRADPLGAKAFYESLHHLIPAERHLLSLAKLGDGRDTTLLWLGADPDGLRFSSGDFKEIETFVRAGGRLVLSLAPVREPHRTNRFQTLGNRGTRPGWVPTTNSPPSQPEPVNATEIPVSERWDLSFEFARPADGQNATISPSGTSSVQRDPRSGLPKKIAVHSGMYFGQLGEGWRTVYARAGTTNPLPVIIERPLGRGTLVLCAESYYFSNESLRRVREPELLAWFIGPARKVLFDETHLGVRETPGVATLARQYRLESFFASLLVLAGLFVWKNSVSFMPPLPGQLEREEGHHIAGKDSTSGFINLLRRHIAPADLMKTCLEQWNAHSSPTRKPSRTKLEAMQRIIDAENALEPGQRNPVATYRKLSEIRSART